MPVIIEGHSKDRKRTYTDSRGSTVPITENVLPGITAVWQNNPPETRAAKVLEFIRESLETPEGGQDIIYEISDATFFIDGSRPIEIATRSYDAQGKETVDLGHLMRQPSPLRFEFLKNVEKCVRALS